MISATQKAHIRPIHPFPARMAPSIVWDALPRSENALNVLDPMSGSGTTLVCARARGHRAIGCDTDPLARLIARAWSADVEAQALEARAELVLERAKTLIKKLSPNKSYPKNADSETRLFIDFWFDRRNRRELNSLATCITRVRSIPERTLLWCAFSRLIITKTTGTSLAMDVSHSRPHKVYETAPVKAFDVFLKAVSTVARNCPFPGYSTDAPHADIRNGDARALPVRSNSIDMIVTSPPYLNAIDYLRGHKFSLVWMGYNISELRALRASNIGTEISKQSSSDSSISHALDSMGKLKDLSSRHFGMIRRYVYDMDNVIRECARVLKEDGAAVFVVGNSSIRGTYVKNSEAVTSLAESHGISLVSRVTRPIESKWRYLPPPQSKNAGIKMQTRMRKEVILEFVRESR